MTINNETLLTTTSIVTSIENPYNKSPFDSWYIGGLLFMLIVLLVLLYANFYRENSLNILWTQLLMKLHIVQSSSQTSSPVTPSATTSVLIES